MKRARAVAGVLAILGALVLGPGVDPAAAFNAPLVGYGAGDGSLVCDTTFEINPPYSDVSCASGASGWIGATGSTVSFGLVTEVDPRDSGNGGPLESMAYVVAIGVNGVQVATVGVNGKGTNDTDSVYAKCVGLSNNYDKLASTAISDGSLAIHPMAGTPYFRMDFDIPLASLTSCGITPTTPVQLYYGTSTSANLDNINKDYFRTGDTTVDFSGLATIQLGGSLALTKAATPVSGPNPPAPGQTSTYDLAVTATDWSMYALSNVNVTDSLPSGVQLVSESAPVGTVSVAGQQVTWSGFGLTAGANATLTMRVSVTPGTADLGSTYLLNGGANGSAARGDGVAVSASSNSVSTGVVSGPVLTLTKVANPSFVAAGGSVGYTLTLGNSGTTTATVTSVVDTLPSGFTFGVGSTGGTLAAGAPIVSGSTVTWNGPFSVAAGASRTLTFSATASSTPGSYPNTATASASNAATASTGPTASVTVNSPPTAQPDSSSTPRGAAVGVDVLANDTDPNVTNTLAVTGVTVPSAGTAVIDAGTGHIVYTPPAGFSGVATFGYTISDGFGGTSSSTVSVTVVNGVPTANADSFTATPGATDTVAVLDNDSDPDGDSLLVTAVGTASHGTTALTAGGAVTYTASTSYVGTDAFTYTVSDGRGGTAVATVSVTIPNTAPTAVDDSSATLANQPVTLAVLPNDTDPNSAQTLSVTAVTSPAHGTAVINGDGTVTYTPTISYVGPDAFDYTLSDGAATDLGHVAITVSAGTPVAVDDAASTGTNAGVTIPVLTNDVGFLTLSVAAGSITGPVVVPPVGPPSGVPAGTAVLNADGTITFTPATGFTGTAAFTYRATDGTSTSAPATVTITVANAAPVAVNDTVPNGTRAAGQAVDVLANDTDANNDALTITGVSGVSAGASVSVDAGGGPGGRDRVLYTPPAGFTGTDTFSYAVADGRGGSSSATVAVTIADNPPVAVDDTAGPAAGPTSIAVLRNDTDPDGDALTVTSATTPGSGTAVVNPDSTITYTPTAGFVGTDSFDYTIGDGHGMTDSGRVTVTVPNTAPVAQADNATTTVGTAVTVGVLTNDTDVNPLQTLSVVSATSPSHGTVVVNGDGTITYTPAGTYRGPDSFTYTIRDGAGGTDSALVSVTVNDRAPLAADDSKTTRHDTATSVAVLTNDTDPDGDSLAVVAGSVTTPLVVVPIGPPGGPAGSAVLNPDGTVTYTPSSGFSGTASFSYDVTDGQLTDTAVVTVSVVNATPVANDDTATTAQDTAVAVTVVSNDGDADGDTLGVVPGTVGSPVTSLGAPAGSTLLNPNGTITYTPAAGFSGTATFGYDVTDGIGTDAGVVTVTVTAVVPSPTPTPASPSPTPASPTPAPPAPPTPAPATPAPANQPPAYTDAPANTTQSVSAGSPLQPLAATDPDGDPLSYELTGGALPPGVQLQADGTFRGAALATGDFPVQLKVCDDGNPALCSETRLVIRVQALATASPAAIVVDASPSPAPATPAPATTPSPTPTPDADGGARVDASPTRPFLPRTGAPLALLLVAGLGSLLAGSTLRVGARNRAT